MISIHNSENELAQKPELIQKLGIGQFIYQGKDGDTLPFCQYMHGADKPGKFILVCYFHGAGSRGNDNFLKSGSVRRRSRRTANATVSRRSSSCRNAAKTANGSTFHGNPNPTRSRRNPRAT